MPEANEKPRKLIQVKKVVDVADLEKVFEIRRRVFVIEQNCPPEIEWEFEDESTHFLATVNGEPAGASRWRKTDKGYKLERFAVLAPFRGGVGKALVKAVLDDLPADAFEEAGIQHYKTVLKN
jgi:predicted GNAT family N-acyltransferase